MTWRTGREATSSIPFLESLVMLRTTWSVLVLAVVCLLDASASAQWAGLGSLHRQVPEFVAQAYDRAEIVLADFDGDGARDLVAVAGTAGCLLAFNDGDGRFTESPDAFPGVQSSGVAVGDVDGDGDLDIVFPMRLFLNDGTGAFTEAPGKLPTANYVTCVKLADVDGDGDLDAIVGVRDNSPFDGTFKSFLCRNDGTGLFARDVDLDVGPTYDLAVGDVDRDGDVDIIIGYGYICGVYGCFDGFPNSLLRNDGTGHFSKEPFARIDVTYSVRLADLDGDGDLDLFVANDNRYDYSDTNDLYLNDGLGHFTEALDRIPNRADSRSLAITDVDGDGDADVLVGQTGLDLLRNDGTAHFADEPSTSPVRRRVDAIASADLDGDGDQDLCLFSSEIDGEGNSRQGTLHVLLGRNDGTFVDPNEGHDLPTSCKLGDLDGDGDLDAVLEHASENVIWRNDGSGGLHPAPQLWPGGATGFVTLVDIEGDGDLDLFDGGDDYSQRDHRLCVNDGHGFLTEDPSRLPPSVSFPWRGYFADLDHDGDVDLLELNDSGSAREMYLNDGLGHFTRVTGKLPGIAYNDRWTDLAFGDVDADGDADVLVANSKPGSVPLLFLNQGDGSFVDASDRIPSLAYDATGVSLGDVDGDLDLDAVLSVRYGPTHLYVNDGHGYFTDVSSRLPSYDDLSYDAVFVDIDSDGDLDIVIANDYTDFSYLDYHDRLYINDGAGNFTEHPELIPAIWDLVYSFSYVSLGGYPAFGDLDGDGDVDAVLGQTVYSNLQRQLAWRSLPRIGRTFDLDLWGSPHGRWVLLLSPETEIGKLPGRGGLGLPPVALVPLLRGKLDASGRYTVPVPVPYDPSLIGLTAHTQALVDSPTPRLTNVELLTVSDR
jgi:large repetitive protein